MSILLTADLHLTDLEKDSDRWNLFPWVEKQIVKYHIKYFITLGDLTDAKDKHSATLTNKIVNTFSRLSKQLHVIILRGNHDFVNEDTPYFRFLRRLEGDITYVNKPTFLNMDRGHDSLVPNIDDVQVVKGLFLPCVRDYKKAWADKPWREHEPDYIFTHQSYDG